MRRGGEPSRGGLPGAGRRRRLGRDQRHVRRRGHLRLRRDGRHAHRGLDRRARPRRGARLPHEPPHAGAEDARPVQGYVCDLRAAPVRLLQGGPGSRLHADAQERAHQPRLRAALGAAEQPQHPRGAHLRQLLGLGGGGVVLRVPRRRAGPPRARAPGARECPELRLPRRAARRADVRGYYVMLRYIRLYQVILYYAILYVILYEILYGII